MADQTSPVTDVSQSPWHLDMTSNLQDHIPRVGQAVSGFVPHIMGPSTHHRAILNRLSSRELHPEPSHGSSVVVDVDTDNQQFTPPGQEGMNPDLMSHEHFQLPSSFFQNENQNGEGDLGEGGDHGHVHDGATTRFSIKNIILNSGGFLVILSLKLLSQHFLGFFVFLAMFGTHVYANMSMQKVVHQSSLRNSSCRGLILSFLWIITFLSANIAVVLYAFKEEMLWNVLLFCMPVLPRLTVWDYLWMVLVTDFILKFSTIIIKAFLSLLPFGHKRRGKMYMVVENVMQLYRLLTPIIPWFHFLYDDQGIVLGIILVALYFLMKIFQFLAKVLEVLKSFKSFMSDVSYGSRPSSSEVKLCGENCPICQDDYKDPIKLACKHIFCENCVSMWFDREKTCPMCRAQIHTESPMWKDGSTSIHIQWY
uniref:RING finger and transmembrane domain-containing protein 1-like n=1 Tax=Crassostrea virginica TaxID=6565 RepID=A0A8B8ELB2_CRAVI|nr:RING finger and transmembrane domain-containing protein 1-like [Crassostrea virginica]XP_022340529.1 RING finger and transmembrane domain-containing protein 1-like [Crassostrea virginica]